MQEAERQVVDRPPVGPDYHLSVLIPAYHFGFAEACEDAMRGEKYEYAIWLMWLCGSYLWMYLEDEGLVEKGVE